MKPGDKVIVKLWSGEEIVGTLIREEYLTSGERVIVESGDRVIRRRLRTVNRSPGTIEITRTALIPCRPGGLMSDKPTTKPLVATGVASEEELRQKMAQTLEAINQDPQAFVRMMAEEHPEMLPNGVDIETVLKECFPKTE